MPILAPLAPPATRWRISLNHVWVDVDGKPTFHAYTERDQMACDPSWGLASTDRQPNEGSFFCPKCLDLTKGDR